MPIKGPETSCCKKPAHGRAVSVVTLETEAVLETHTEGQGQKVSLLNIF